MTDKNSIILEYTISIGDNDTVIVISITSTFRL